MPTNRRPPDRFRPFRITPELIARWRLVRPGGIDLGAPGSGQRAGFEDPELAELCGEHHLLAQRSEDMEALFAALERAVAAEGA
jgi:hypothetical protein